MESGIGEPGLKVAPDENESASGKSGESFRAQVDTSAPFESVKEAVSRFGGIGYWKPSHRHKLSELEHDMEEIDITKGEEQAALLEKDLILKERETRDVLKELELTKLIVEELKIKLQKQASEVNVTLDSSAAVSNVTPASKEENKDGHEKLESDHWDLVGGLSSYPSSAPGLILLDLKQAKLKEAAKSQIKRTKRKIKTAEIRSVAARKMKEAAKAAENVALAEIKAISNHENLSGDSLKKSEGIILTLEEQSSLTCKAREAEELSKSKVKDAVLQVDEANVSKMEILKRVEEATEEVKTSKKTLEEALKRVEAANRGKLEVEEALRKWRSEHGQKRRCVHNKTKFKNSRPSHHRRDSDLLYVNRPKVANDGPEHVLKQTLSIGQILSRKLLMSEGCETEMMTEKGSMKRKVPLGQMLSQKSGDVSSTRKAEKENCEKQFCGKRKKFGFAGFSRLLAKQSKKKKKPTLNLRMPRGQIERKPKPVIAVRCRRRA